jgi:hypothetical protein
MQVYDSCTVAAQSNTKSQRIIVAQTPTLFRQTALPADGEGKDTLTVQQDWVSITDPDKEP